MPLGNRLKNFGRNLVIAAALSNEEEVVTFMRSFVVGKLKPYGPEHLAGAIAQDADLWGSLPPRLLNTVRSMARSEAVRKSFTKYSGMISADTVLLWLGGYDEKGEDGKTRHIDGERPDLYSVIVNWPDSKARDWLSKNAAKVKLEFEEAMKQPDAH